ncbi:MAG: HAMP domain-containing sensor histidine kinase [bacterium]|nr:HAMP domain-containing sensor histidine kinase [bacterium]
MFKQLRRRLHLTGKPRLLNSPQRSLKVVLLLFVLAVTLPLYVLFNRVYAQLQQETLYQYRLSAEQVTQQIDAEVNRLIAGEENRPFSHYGFFRIEEQKLLNTRGVALSPLAQFPLASDFPGLIGYFQISPAGRLSSPVLPDTTKQQLDDYDIRVGEEEYAKRLALKKRIINVLETNRLWAQKPADRHPQRPRLASKLDQQRGDRHLGRAQAPAEARPSVHLRDDTAEMVEEARSQREVDLRSTYRGQKVAELNIDRRLYLERESAVNEAKKRSAPSKSKSSRRVSRQPRTEQIDIPASQSLDVYRKWLNKKATEKKEKSNVHGIASESILVSFAGDIDPIQLYVLQDMTFVFVRKVWQAKQRYIQGFIVDGNAFIQQIFQVPFHNSSISAVSRLVVSYRDDILKQIAPGPAPYGQKHRGIFKRSADAEVGKTPSLLYQTRLASPFDDVLMHFTITSLPLGPGATLVHALVVIIPALLLAGMFGVYRLTTQQIKLAEARQDFVSAVSHELKTPLTSIRMYGEMLRSGWVQDDAKRQTYYDFIFFESERLSRLVANVLHLARLSKNDTRLQLKPYAPTALLDLVRSKVDTQIEAAGFSLEVVNGLADADDSALRVEAEEDAFTRIFINLVDNALKFSANAEQKVVRLELRASDSPRPQVIFSVRDYGPGVERGQMKKIFQLFYRAGSELTRTTPGTGIGLALAKQLATALHAEVDLKNHHPGAEFLVKFRPLQPR